MSTNVLKRIIVAIDGSASSKKAANVGAKLAKDYGAELTLLHVLPPPTLLVDVPTGIGPAPLGVQQYYTAAEDSAAKWMGEAKEEALKIGATTVKTALERTATSPVEAIVDYAAREKADLIIMGTRGLGGFKRLLLGSVSSGVVTHANCSVMVVR
jgi:nucleotide-binding universal stress UspA family protein